MQEEGATAIILTLQAACQAKKESSFAAQTTQLWGWVCKAACTTHNGKSMWR
jgi:hypothetical protein